MIPYRELLYRSKLNPCIVLASLVLPIVGYYLLLRVDYGVWWRVNLSDILSFSVSYAALWVLYLNSVNHLARLQAACIRSAADEMGNGEPKLSCQNIKSHPLLSIRKKLLEIQEKNIGKRGRVYKSPLARFYKPEAEDVEYPKEKDTFWEEFGINPASYIKVRPLWLLPFTYYYWLLFREQEGPLGVEPKHTLERILKHPTQI